MHDIEYFLIFDVLTLFNSYWASADAFFLNEDNIAGCSEINVIIQGIEGEC